MESMIQEVFVMMPRASMQTQTCREADTQAGKQANRQEVTRKHAHTFMKDKGPAGGWGTAGKAAQRDFSQAAGCTA